MPFRTARSVSPPAIVLALIAACSLSIPMAHAADAASAGAPPLDFQHLAPQASDSTRALPDVADSQSVLAELGTAYAKAGKAPAAIDAYLRSAAVFAGSDTSALAPLRAAWKKEHGSLAGLDTRIETMRHESTRRIAL